MPRVPRLDLVRTVEPSGVFPVTLAEIKSHCRIDISDDDALLTAYLGAAVRTCEEQTRRSIMPQTWRLTLDEFPDGELNSRISPAIEGLDILLPRPPFVGVTSIAYKDTNGADRTLGASVYLTLSDAEPPRLALKVDQVWPDTYAQPGAVVITYTTGWPNAAAVPDPIKQAIKFLAAHLYENREPVVIGTIATSLPMAFDFLLSPFVLREWF